MNESTEHPKAIEARRTAAARNQLRKAEQNELNRYRQELGFKFLRIRNTTVAYRIDKRDVFHIATTVKHPGDKDDPHTAKLIAARRLKDKRCITLRRAKFPVYTPSPKQFITALLHPVN